MREKTSRCSPWCPHSGGRGGHRPGSLPGLPVRYARPDSQSLRRLRKSGWFDDTRSVPGRLRSDDGDRPGNVCDHRPEVAEVPTHDRVERFGSGRLLRSRLGGDPRHNRHQPARFGSMAGRDPLPVGRDCLDHRQRGVGRSDSLDSILASLQAADRYGRPASGDGACTGGAGVLERHPVRQVAVGVGPGHLAGRSGCCC